MSTLRFTAAHSSRITKRSQPAKSPLKKRQSSKPSKTSSPRRNLDNEFERLEETGLWAGSWDPDGDQPENVLEAMRYALDHQFTPMPEDLRGLGLSREGIAEVLNFRKFLPPVVPVHHLHSLLPTLTRTQRELNRLTANGTLRRIEIEATGWEGFITSEDYEQVVKSSSGLSEDVKTAFLRFLSTNPGTNRVLPGPLTAETIRELLVAGFLTFENPQAQVFPSSDGSSDIQSLTATTTMRSTGLNYKPAGPAEKSLLGTIASVSSISTSVTKDRSTATTGYWLSVPRLGSLLKLIQESRQHLISLLSRSPFGETTEQLLTERWDGGVSKGNQRNQKSDKFAGRTKKWKDFKGLSFSWVLGGLLGGGGCDGFSTPIGRGIRLVKGKR